ncbi:SDR family oxidoreductase [Croceicoccus sediminis]|uniref:SDR family oxidoreductase n=1 Tax=Croceicoccus sediminis TaxID=2571150 RepID=UPI001F102046|nr:SDR family oxidoreductase [Croceicoccus sediminis]
MRADTLVSPLAEDVGLMASMFDFGLAGKRAIVCGSSQGLGFACAEALLQAGVEVIVNGRSKDRLDDAAAALMGDGRKVTAVAADVATAEGRRALLDACPAPDILVTNAGGPPPGDIGDWDDSDWFDALGANMVAPIQLIKSALPGMRERKWGRIINITSMAVKMPLPRLGLSNGARSGLTGFVAGLAREVAPDGVTINNLLPGRFSTERLNRYMADLADEAGRSRDAYAEDVASGIPVKRLGRPEEFGAFCLFIASEHAGYMTGQNILLDGGEYPGAL